jgi:hypothetical protein
MFVRPGRVDRVERPVTYAADGERAEPPARRAPRPDCAQQADPGLLGNVVALTAARQPELGDNRAAQRVVAAQQFS